MEFLPRFGDSDRPPAVVNGREADSVPATEQLEMIADGRKLLHLCKVIPTTSLERLKGWARAIRRDVVALWLAAGDPRVPWHAKALAAAVAAYALSPIDLIPDFIPLLGYLDDLLIVPLGILLAVRLIPPPILAELRARALEHGRPVSRAGLALVISIWLAAAGLALWLAWPAG